MVSLGQSVSETLLASAPLELALEPEAALLPALLELLLLQPAVSIKAKAMARAMERDNNFFISHLPFQINGRLFLSSFPSILKIRDDIPHQ